MFLSDKEEHCNIVLWGSKQAMFQTTYRARNTFRQIQLWLEALDRCQPVRTSIPVFSFSVWALKVNQVSSSLRDNIRDSSQADVKRCMPLFSTCISREAFPAPHPSLTKQIRLLPPKKKRKAQYLMNTVREWGLVVIWKMR